MRAQLTSVADRLGAVAKDLRAQADEQRAASAGDVSVAAAPGGWVAPPVRPSSGSWRRCAGYAPSN